MSWWLAGLAILVNLEPQETFAGYLRAKHEKMGHIQDSPE